MLAWPCAITIVCMWAWKKNGLGKNSHKNKCIFQSKQKSWLKGTWQGVGKTLSKWQSHGTGQPWRSKGKYIKDGICIRGKMEVQWLWVHLRITRQSSAEQRMADRERDSTFRQQRSRRFRWRFKNCGWAVMAHGSPSLALEFLRARAGFAEHGAPCPLSGFSILSSFRQRWGVESCHADREISVPKIVRTCSCSMRACVMLPAREAMTKLGML